MTWSNCGNTCSGGSCCSWKDGPSCPVIHWTPFCCKQTLCTKPSKCCQLLSASHLWITSILYRSLLFIAISLYFLPFPITLLSTICHFLLFPVISYYFQLLYDISFYSHLLNNIPYHLHHSPSSYRNFFLFLFHNITACILPLLSTSCHFLSFLYPDISSWILPFPSFVVVVFVNHRIIKVKVLFHFLFFHLSFLQNTLVSSRIITLAFAIQERDYHNNEQ